MTQKVVINSCYRGFGLSNKAIQRYEELSGKVVPSVTVTTVGANFSRYERSVLAPNGRTYSNKGWYETRPQEFRQGFRI